jgi:hypothetical protein
MDLTELEKAKIKYRYDFWSSYDDQTIPSFNFSEFYLDRGHLLDPDNDCCINKISLNLF